MADKELSPPEQQPVRNRGLLPTTRGGLEAALASVEPSDETTAPALDQMQKGLITFIFSDKRNTYSWRKM